MTRGRGALTFLMTDVEGSTLWWERSPEHMAVALARHDQILAEAVRRYRGRVVKPRGEGDSVFAVFRTAAAAVRAAARAQAALRVEEWPGEVVLRVRMAVHTGEVLARNDDFYGPTINRCARLRGLAHGGQVLLSVSSVDACGELPAPYSIRDRGFARLRDIATPEHVFELAGPGLSEGLGSAFGDPAARAGLLPHVLGRFVGRADEVEAVAQLLALERLVTVTGPGGVGKTRLAVEAARMTRSSPPGGEWFVDLSAVTEDASVALAVAGSVGATSSTVTGVLESIAGALRPGALIVLDNCEQVISGVRSMVTFLLERGLDVRFLATSRTGTGVRGEVIFPLGPLDEALDAAAGREWSAVELFVDRARRAQSGKLPQEDRDSIARICRRLDGLPLAIELAAARSATFGLAKLEPMLVEVLAGESNDAEQRERHANLQTVVDWSCRLLSEDARRLFSALCIFAGRFDHSAAAAVAGLGDRSDFEVISKIDELVRHALLTVDPERGMPYLMLETIRQAGRRELKAAGAWHAACDLHATYLLALLAKLDSRYLDAEATDVAMAMIEDVRAALAWLLEQRDADRAATASWHAQRLWRRTGRLSEGRLWHSRVLDLDGAAASDEAAALVRVGRAELAIRGGDLTVARTDLEWALQIGVVRANPWIEVHARYNLAWVALADGDPLEAGRQAALVTEIAARLNTPHTSTLAAWFNAELCRHRNDLRAAKSHMEHAVRTSATCDPDLHLMARLSLGELLFALGENQEAEEELTEAYDIAVQLGNDYSQVDADWGRCSIALTRDQLDVAAAALSRALHTARNMSDLTPSLLVPAGVLALALNDQPLARRLLSASRATPPTDAWNAKAQRSKLEASVLDDEMPPPEPLPRIVDDALAALNRPR